MRISVSCSRAALVSFRASSSSRSVVHRPSFGSGWTSRSYASDVSPDRSILRPVFRDTRRSRAICLIVLPLTKCSRRIRPIVSTVSIPPPPASNQSEQRIRPNWRGSILDADNPLQGVKIARRITGGREHGVAGINGILSITDEMGEAILMCVRMLALCGEAIGEPHFRFGLAEERGRHHLAARRRDGLVDRGRRGEGPLPVRFSTHLRRCLVPRDDGALAHALGNLVSPRGEWLCV